MSFETEKLVENLGALISKLKSHKKFADGTNFYFNFRLFVKKEKNKKLKN